MWGQHLKLLRQNRWIRGGIYAADGFDFKVTGKHYEKMGKRWDPDENRWIRGYKVEVLFNVTPGRERIVGLAMGPAEMDERKLLLQLLQQIRDQGIEPKDLIDLLIFDRGYWGTAFFDTLVRKWGLNFLTLARSDLMLVTDVKALQEGGDHPFQKRKIQRASGKVQEIEVAGIEKVVICDHEDKVELTVNTVLARGVDYQTGEIRERVFVTSQPTARFPHRAIERYNERWEIENQGIREFSQRWQARIPVGRKRNAIWAQLHMLAMLYNAVKVYAMKCPKDAAQLQKECRQRARRSYLGGRAILVFIPGRRIYTAVSEREFEDLVRKRTVNQVRQMIEAGLSLEEALAKVGK